MLTQDPGPSARAVSARGAQPGVPRAASATQLSTRACGACRHAHVHARANVCRDVGMHASRCTVRKYLQSARRAIGILLGKLFLANKGPVRRTAGNLQHGSHQHSARLTTKHNKCNTRERSKHLYCGCCYVSPGHLPLHTSSFDPSPFDKSHTVLWHPAL